MDARDIVSKLCYSVVNYDTELKLTDNEKTHELSDGNITEQEYSLTASAERWIARDVKDKRCYLGVNYD